MESTLYLERPGGRIAYDARGEGGLVVCVPGMGDLRSSFHFVRPGLLDAGFRVATMDLRGHGDSDATFENYDDVSAGMDILALVEELGGPAVLVGNSMGAGAAAWAAAESPVSVAGLVLIDPFVRNPPVSLAALLAFRLALVRPWGYAAWRAYYRSLYPGREPEGLARHQQAIEKNLHRPGHWRAFVATTRTSHAPVEARLGEVRAPALVVMGDSDRDFRDPAAEARWVAAKLHGDEILVRGAGHYPHAQYPEVVTPKIIEFASRALSA
jgi:pimeloyl-ACP methyl ester carboxylesterase